MRESVGTAVLGWFRLFREGVVDAVKRHEGASVRLLVRGYVAQRRWSAWAKCGGRSGGATGLRGVPARGDQDDPSAPSFSGGDAQSGGNLASRR